MMTQVYHPTYLGSGDQEDHVSRPAQAKISQDPISTNIAHDYLPSYRRSINRRVIVQAKLGIK
jgi:hypothetical protein